MFVLESPIVIGSLWCRCTARLGVAGVRSNVVTFWMSQYTNFIWGRIRWGHSLCTSHSTVSSSMGTTFQWESSCRDSTWHRQSLPPVESADRQAQFDVLAGRASKSYDNGNASVQIGDYIPCPSSLHHYWSYFESMQGPFSTFHFIESCHRSRFRASQYAKPGNE